MMWLQASTSKNGKKALPLNMACSGRRNIACEKHRDSELLILNATGQQLSTHTIKKGYNLITLTGLSPGLYLIAIRQNENIIETHKIIKQ
jgi:hypothetical protein